MADLKYGYSRFIMKRLSESGSTFSVPTSATVSTWDDGNLFPGEIGINMADDAMFFRTSNGIVELATTSTSSVITAGDGLEKIGTQINLGGDVQGPVVFTVSGSGSISYASDYSSDFFTYSLVDKNYVDTAIAGITGGSGASYSFTNGLSATNSIVKLGGILTDLTTHIDLDGNYISIANGDFTTGNFCGLNYFDMYGVIGHRINGSNDKLSIEITSATLSEVSDTDDIEIRFKKESSGLDSYMRIDQYGFSFDSEQGFDFESGEDIRLSTGDMVIRLYQDEIRVSNNTTTATAKGMFYADDYSSGWTGDTLDSMIATKGYVDREVASAAGNEYFGGTGIDLTGYTFSVNETYINTLIEATDLGDLNNVDTTGATTGQVLGLSGSQWVAVEQSTGTSYTFGNGLTAVNGNVKMGGEIDEDTTIEMGTYSFNLNGSSNNSLNFSDTLFNARIDDNKIQMSDTTIFLGVDDVWESYINMTEDYVLLSNITGGWTRSFMINNVGGSDIGFKFTDTHNNPAVRGVQYESDYSTGWLGTSSDSLLATKGYVDREVASAAGNEYFGGTGIDLTGYTFSVNETYINTLIEATDLGDLNNVDTTGATTGQVLGLSGSQWVAIEQSGGGTPISTTSSMPYEMAFACSDESTALTTGTALTLYSSVEMDLETVYVSLNGADTTDVEIDLTIGATTYTLNTGTYSYLEFDIADMVISQGDLITVNVISTTDAYGLKMSLLGERDVYTIGGVMPSGVSASRPSSPVKGQQYLDDTLGYPIVYDGTQWINYSGSAV